MRIFVIAIIGGLSMAAAMVAAIFIYMSGDNSILAKFERTSSTERSSAVIDEAIACITKICVKTTEDIIPGEGLSNCRSAVAAYPESGEFMYYLGRGEETNKDYEMAKTNCEKQ